eukprot:scaffold280621_cov35-Attheya_sp.AAC.1
MSEWYRMEKIFSRDTFMALHLPFRSLLAPAETIRGEIEAILYTNCEPYRSSLTGGILQLTFCSRPLTFFVCRCTEQTFMTKMRVRVSSQAAGASKNHNG